MERELGSADMLLVVLLVVFTWPSLAAVGVAHQSITVYLQAQGKISVPGSLMLERGPQAFTSYSVMLPVSYRIRTPLDSVYQITVQANGDFVPTGGPNIGAGDLTFTCGGATYGVPCSGAQAVSSTAQRRLLTVPGPSCTGGGGLCSQTDPSTVQMNLQLSNNPTTPTGVYSVSLVFTISSI
jgi:hypothetical protein